MIIKEVIRPGQNKVKQGNRYNKDSFYNTSTWKQIRETHINGSTVMPDGFVLSNKYCVECYPLLVPMHAVDHRERRKAGGEDDLNNLQSLCVRHHAQKSANESNEAQKQRK